VTISYGSTLLWFLFLCDLLGIYRAVFPRVIIWFMFVPPFHRRKSITNLDSILKSRDITLPTKVHLVKVMVFSVVMYGYESWTIKKAESWRIDAFELGCWRRLLKVPWTARRSNQSVLKEISPEYSLEGLILKLNTSATWCKEPTHWKKPWCWERLKVGGEGDDRGWDGWMASPSLWEWVWASSGSLWWTGKPGVLQSMGSQRMRQDQATELNRTCTSQHILHIIGTQKISGKFHFIVLLLNSVERKVIKSATITLEQWVLTIWGNHRLFVNFTESIDQYFSKVNACRNHQKFSWKCRFWCGRPGWSQIIYFYQAPMWCWGW